MESKVLKFGKHHKLSDIKEAILQAPALLKLEILECPAIDNHAIEEIAQILNVELETFIVRKSYFSDKAVEVIAKRCPKLQHVKFAECKNVGEFAMKALGNNCKELRTIAFIYENNLNWLVDDALSVLVKSCSSELHAISFVGFNDVTDIGVNYAADCYQNTLSQVDFSECPQLTDKSLIGLAVNCKFLRDVALSSTNITDSGLQVLAEKCSRLQRVNFAHCTKITDQGVKSLAKTCPQLLKVNFDNCSQLGDASLVAIASNCLGVEDMNFDRTSIHSIPALIIGLKRLRTLSTRMCRGLIHPPPEIVHKEIYGLLDFYREYSLSYRLKVFFLGDLGSGKTSLVRSLIEGTARTVEAATEGVSVELWQPFKNTNNVNLVERELRREEKNLTLDVWDLSGRQVCQGAHQVYLTGGALYIIVFNLLDQSSCESVSAMVHMVQNKAPGSTIIIVGSRLDKGFSNEDKRKKKCEEVLKPVLDAEQKHIESIKAEIDIIRDFGDGANFETRMKELNRLLRQRVKLPSQCFTISSCNGKGLDALRREIFSKVLDFSLFPLIVKDVKPQTVNIYEKILQLRRKGTVVMPWSEFQDVALTALDSHDTQVKEQLKQETKFLQTVGGLLDFSIPFVPDHEEKYRRLIVINPSVFASILTQLHVDDDKKAFKFEARRFWPKDSGHPKPDPGILVRALEEIPTKGFIREVLFPLLWQESNVTEEQVLLLVNCLSYLGILAKYTPTPMNHSEGLALPNYKSLSTQTRYYAPLLGLLPDNRPQLNWTPWPFRGDLQIGWRYTFPSGCSQGVLQRLLAVCRRASQADSYQHYWRNGVLLKIGESMVCLMHGDSWFEVACRVNADEDGEEEKACELIWMHLARFVQVANCFLADWNGLYYRVSLVPMGRAFFSSKVEGEQSFLLHECLSFRQQGEVLRFRDVDAERKLDLSLLLPFEPDAYDSISHWLDFNVKQSEVFQKEETQQLPSPLGSPSRSNSKTALKKPKRKNVEIKWNLDNDTENSSEPASRKLSREKQHNSTTTTTNIAKPQTETHTNSPKSQENNHKTKEKEKNMENSAKNDDKNNNEFEEGGKKVARYVSEEEEEKEALKVASGFVAAVLASAVADYIRMEYEDNKMVGTQDGINTMMVSAAQVEAARVTASAALAAQTGNIDQAAKAVMAAAKAMQDAVSQVQEESRKNIKSKLCIIV